MSKRRVVITGLGVISPVGNSVATAWAAVKAGQSGIGKITRFDPSLFPAQIAGEIKNFDPTAWIEKKDVKRLDLFSQYCVAAAQEAWDDAKLSTNPYGASRSGCILGIGIGGLGILETVHNTFLEGGPRKISPFLIPAMIANLGPGNVAIRFGLKGINFAISSACTSATHAIGEAYRMIAEGVQDMMITGGTESAVTQMSIGGFCSLKALSTMNEEPTKASRPFDRDRDGFVLSEGSAVLVLEDREQALKRGAHIYSEIVGYGFSCDAYHITAPPENGEGAITCMREAIAHAGIQPEQVGYVNAHGTSTPANDSTETKAIKQVFGEYAHNGLLVSSTKSMTGHLLGAAGAIEAVFAVLAITDSIVPPTINLDHPDDGCDLDYVPHHAREKVLDYTISNSFGFGGTNATVVFAKPQ